MIRGERERFRLSGAWGVLGKLKQEIFVRLNVEHLPITGESRGIGIVAWNRERMGGPS